VALDCDEAGGRAAQKVVPILHEAGYEVAARDMGGTDGFDMRDFCRLHQDDSLGALAKCKLLALDAEAHAAPEQEQTYRWRLRSRDDLMQQSVPVDLLEGVFSTRSLVMLYSEFGAGKSVVAADMAMALAQQHNVLYVAAEAFYIYNPRVRGWELHHRLTTERLHWIDDAINLGNPAEVDRLIGIAQALNIAMVVVDTYSASTNAFGMNENDNGDSERAAHQLKRIRKETGATVLVVHHQGKAGNGSRGGTALPAACDTIYHLEARDDVLVFACEKARMSTKPDTRYFRIIEKTTDLVDDDGNTITAPVLLPAARVDMQKSPLSERDKDVLAELCGEILSKGARQVDVAEALGLSQRNLAKRSLEKLMKHGYVTMSENKLFCATAEGKAFHERQLQVTPGVTSGDSGDESYTLNWRVRPPKPKNVLQHPNAEVTASYSDVTPEVTGEKLQVTGVTPPFRGVTCVTETEVELVMTEEQANVQAEAEAPADHALPRPRSIPIRRRVESASESAKPEAAEPRLPEGPLGLPAGWKEAWTASKAYIQARHPDLGVHTDAYPRTSSGLQELLRDIEKLEAEHALARRE
jgi:DNA-binding Lrp family transcriptional regulator/archaellum biogenesis ATPase FlaH